MLMPFRSGGACSIGTGGRGGGRVVDRMTVPPMAAPARGCAAATVASWLGRSPSGPACGALSTAARQQPVVAPAGWRSWRPCGFLWQKGQRTAGYIAPRRTACVAAGHCRRGSLFLATVACRFRPGTAVAQDNEKQPASEKQPPHDHSNRGLTRQI